MGRTTNVLVAAVLGLAFGMPVRAQVLEWASCYDGPGDYVDTALALAVDSAGHVYVTGASREFGGNPDYATVKYDADGDTLWVRRYNSPSNEFDLGRAVLPDAHGNVYVTGSPVTMKYGPDGRLLWSHDNDAEYVSLAFDPEGNIVGAGTGVEVIKTVKLDPDGNLLWEALYTSPVDAGNRGHDMAVDSEGHVVVAGQCWGMTAPADGTQWNFATVKLDAATGDTLWTRRYNGPAAPREVPTDIAFTLAVDTLDHVYVAGWSDGAAGRPQCLTIKYGPDGEPLWERRYPTGGSGGFACYDLLVDRGFVYVAARGAGDALLKYAPDGTLLWASVYPADIGFATNPPRLAADADGNVYMTSTTSAAGGTRQDYVVLKHTPAGVREWAFVYPGTGVDQTNAAYALAVDTGDNVYVTGGSSGPVCPGANFDYLTLKLSQSPTSGEPGSASSGYTLGPSHPNPSSAATTISYTLPSPAHVTLRVYDVLGRAVATLADETQAAGTHLATFNAAGLPGGVYVYRMEAGAFSQTRRLTLIR